MKVMNIKKKVFIPILMIAVLICLTAGYKDTANAQMPEGCYSNEYDEILKIEKKDDGTYSILEYGVTHLLYVENAVGIYNAETDVLEFSGKDDRGNDIKAEIKNKLDYLEVTVTQSIYEDIIGIKQAFYKVENEND